MSVTFVGGTGDQFGVNRSAAQAKRRCLKPRLSAFLYLAWPFIARFTDNIFREDKDIVEREQAAHDAQGDDWNNEIFPAICDLRELLARCGIRPE